MSLRKKTLITIGLTIVSLIVILYATSRIILLGSFAALEEQNTSRNVERALNALSKELSLLDATNSDWAAWDDTYTFIEDANEDYIRSNLVDGTFTTLRLNLMLFIHSSGRIVFGKAFDLQNEEEMPVPQSFQEHLSNNGLLLRHPSVESSIIGIILLPEGPMLISSRPILTSEDEGPIRGSLIIGRYLDSTEIERLAETTNLSLTVRGFEDQEMPLDFQEVRSSLEEAPILVRPLSERSIAGYALLKDIYGRPALVLRVDMPRNIYEQGQASIRYFLLSLLAVGLVFGVVTLLPLEKYVLSRLAYLSKSVSSIGASGNLSARMAMTGEDELSSLAGEINGMLEALELSGEALRESEERFQQVAENALEWIWEVDAHGLYTYASPVVEKILGYKPEEVVGKKHFYDLFHPGDREELKKAAFEVFAQKQSFHEFLNWNVHKDGNTVCLSTSGVPILDEKGNLLGYRGADTDITERKRAEEALKDYSERLEEMVKERTKELRDAQARLIQSEKLAATGRLAVSVAHEINNPLQGISNYLSVISKHVTEDDPWHEDIKMVKLGFERIAEIVRRLRAFYRPAGEEMEPTDINGVVERVLTLVRHQLSLGQVQVKTELAEQELSVLGSVGQLEQVLVNLVLNAQEAMPRGGELTVRTALRDDMVQLQVSDTGKGIGAEEMSMIFEPFYSGKGGKGLGLGLWVSHNIIEGHGGRIEVESKVGEGTTFTISLPAYQRER